MADYVIIDNLSKKGKIGISYLALESLVSDAIASIPGVAKSSKRLKKNQTFRLNRPVYVGIKNGVVHVWVAIETDPTLDQDALVKTIEDEIHTALITATEQVPFDIQVVVENNKKANEKAK